MACHKKCAIALVTLNIFLCVIVEALKLNDIDFDLNVSVTLIGR